MTYSTSRSISNTQHSVNEHTFNGYLVLRQTADVTFPSCTHLLLHSTRPISPESGRDEEGLRWVNMTLSCLLKTETERWGRRDIFRLCWTLEFQSNSIWTSSSGIGCLGSVKGPRNECYLGKIAPDVVIKASVSWLTSVFLCHWSSLGVTKLNHT